MKRLNIQTWCTRGLGVCILIGATFTNAWAQDAYRVETFSVNDNVTIDVETSGGSIEVEGRSSDEVRVEMYVKKRGRTVKAGEDELDDWNINIEKKGNTVYAQAKRQNRGWNNSSVSISFVIYSPIQAKSKVRTSGGSITLNNLLGDQDANTSGGRITATEIGGNVELKTSGGTITVEDIEGFVDANTSGGRIRAEGVTGGIKARTSGGSITLEEVSGNIEAKTSGGSIDAEVMNPDEFVELRTSGGSISITVPKQNGYDLDLDGNRVRADLENFKGNYEKDEISGTMNGGGTKISARTSGGSVTLRYF